MRDTKLATALVLSGWCHVCGREAFRLIVLHLPCPWCATVVRIRLCEDCARMLVQEIAAGLGVNA